MKKAVFILLLLTVSVLPFQTFGENAPAGDGWTEVKVKYSKNFKKIKDIIPPGIEGIVLEETKTNFLPIKNPKADRQGYCVEIENYNTLKIDVDGDGNTDKSISKRESYVTFKLPNAEGDGTRKYHLRFFQDGTKWVGENEVPVWKVGKGCYLETVIEKTRVKIFDENLDGSFNEFGTDGMLVGKGKYASFLSNLVLIKDALYEIKLTADGSKLWYKPYTGATGKVDFFSNFVINNKEKPKAVIIKSDKNVSINAVPEKGKEALVPVGKYRLVYGIISKMLWVKANKFPQFEVKENETTVVEWGGPFSLNADPYVAYGGTIYTFIPPGTYVPPERRPTDLDCPFIKIEYLPTVLGKNGEEYILPEKFKDKNGFGFPGQEASFFEVNIWPYDEKDNQKDEGSNTKKKKRKGKALNNIGNPEVDRWTQYDLSGLISKIPKEWDIYQCPLYEFRGKVIMEITASTKSFGVISFEKILDIR